MTWLPTSLNEGRDKVAALALVVMSHLGLKYRLVVGCEGWWFQSERAAEIVPNAARRDIAILGRSAKTGFPVACSSSVESRSSDGAENKP